MRSHHTVSCLACGHALAEPAREVWDAAWFPQNAGHHLGPAWSEEERELWRGLEAAPLRR
jgi:hypothetical protein